MAQPASRRALLLAKPPALPVLGERLLILFGLVLAAALPARPWGDQGHRLVNRAAIEGLPEPLRSYFRAREEYLVEHASAPDLLAHDYPPERRHHYTDADAYDRYPFRFFRQQFVVERRRPRGWQRREGDSVWQIERFTVRLADDWSHHRWAYADRDAVLVAHYACDLTQPLHTTVNYDGQLSGQRGVHSRFETMLVNAAAGQWRIIASPPSELRSLRAAIFREYVESYAQINLVLAADRTAARGRTYLDPQYLPNFIRLAGPMAEKRLDAAASFVSALWYTAWLRAGKPDLSAWRGSRVGWSPP
jgi:hypothetical protein